MGVKVAVVGGGSTYTPELVEGFAARDDRIQVDELALLDIDPGRLEVVVVGSSRSMEVRADFFPGRTFYNSSVGSARLPDYVALYEAYRARGIKPSLFVIGIDPWVLNARFGDQRWRALQADYDRIAARLGLTPNPARIRYKFQAKKWSQLVSPRYF